MVKCLVLQTLFLLFATKCGLGQKQDENKDIQQFLYNGGNLNPETNKHLVQLIIAAAIDYTESSVEEECFICSGSIIGNRWIITSAHCFDDLPKITKVTVERRDREKSYLIAEAVGIVVKDEYNLNELDSMETYEYNIENDIALVYTKRRIEFNDLVQPIPLAKRLVKVGRSAILSGFGEISPGVYAASQGTVELSRCPNDELSYLCSTGSVYAGSGGSLVFKGRLIGVTSRVCSKYTYYTNVAANYDWIMEHMAQDNYKKF